MKAKTIETRVVMHNDAAEQGATTWTVWVDHVLRAWIRHDHREGDGDPEQPWYVVAVNEYHNDRSRTKPLYERDFTAALGVARKLIVAQDGRIAKRWPAS